MAELEIERMNIYRDGRFSQEALLQHGAYLVDGEPYELLITSKTEAMVIGKDTSKYEALIEEFRYHAPHITRFVDAYKNVIQEFQEEELIEVALQDIQPSQFFVDQDKLDAILTFIKAPEDVIVQVMRWQDRYISMDGHTRLYAASQKGFLAVKAVVVEEEDWVWTFVTEARKRGILAPGDLKLLSHEDYEIQWNQYCEQIFNCSE